MSTGEVQITFAALNNLSFMTRAVSENDPFVPDCNTPQLSFVGQNKNLTVSLADRSCVPPGDYYVSAGSNSMRSLFNNEFLQVDQRGELCNRYATYNWSTTSFQYISQSPNSVPQVSRQVRDVTYENQLARVRFKNSDEDRFYCANIVPSETELSILFPTQGSGGLDYSVLRPQSVPTDVAQHQITYINPIDGGGHWQFFLDEDAAATAGGGALLSSQQATAIDDLIQVWVDRVLNSTAVTDCPDPSAN